MLRACVAPAQLMCCACSANVLQIPRYFWDTALTLQTDAERLSAQEPRNRPTQGSQASPTFSRLNLNVQIQKKGTHLLHKIQYWMTTSFFQIAKSKLMGAKAYETKEFMQWQCGKDYTRIRLFLSGVQAGFTIKTLDRSISIETPINIVEQRDKEISHFTGEVWSKVYYPVSLVTWDRVGRERRRRSWKCHLWGWRIDLRVKKHKNPIRYRCENDTIRNPSISFTW